MEEKEYTGSFNWSIWKKLSRFVYPLRHLFLIMCIFNVLCTLVDIILPLFQQYAINHFVANGITQGLGTFAVYYVAVILIQTASLIIFSVAATHIEMNLSKNMKETCFDYLQELSFSYYNVTPVGYIHSRVMSDTSRIAELLAWILADIMWSILYVVGVFGAMLLLNWRLALLVLIVIPIMLVLTVFFQQKILHWNRKVRKENSRITNAYNEGIMGAQTAKTLVIEDKNVEQFCSITRDMYQAGVKAERLKGIYISLVSMCSSVCIAIVLCQGGRMVKENIMLLGTLSAFITYAVRIFDPLQNIAESLSQLVSAQANIERVFGLLEEPTKVQDSKEVVEKYGTALLQKRENWEPIKGEILFEHVSFHYENTKENVLRDVCLHVPAGSTIALVGETGAGKSTLVNLACRFFEPTEGTIYIDGVDYRKRSQSWLHSSLGYVLQTPYLFTGTIMENIRYGKLDATDEEVYEAAKLVSVDRVVAKFPKGWQTQVGEGGDFLSTGEKQLISFARAVLANPSILVLDEATSSIDTETEQLIQNAISYLLKDRTAFIIAHRLSTIRQADQIVVMKDGKIVEQGTHQELQEQKGYYYQLCQSQRSGLIE